MALPDYADDWRRYWETAAADGRRLQLENAAGDPVGRYLTADAPGLVDDDVGIDPVHLRDHPDAVLADARAGFSAFVAESDLVETGPGRSQDRARRDPAGRDGPGDDVGYELLPVHVTALGRVEGLDCTYRDPVADANRLTTMRNVALTEAPTRRDEAAVRTYRCPAGHETTVRQPLLRTWALTTCGDPDCANEVVLEDARTRARSVARFAVDAAGDRLPCVVTGRGATEESLARYADAARLHLTGIPRLVTDDSGGLDPTFEVLAVEPASP